MPLKQPYGKPTVPPRKGQLLTTGKIMDKVKMSSKKDAAFVKRKMAEFYKTHQLRGDEAKPTEIEQLRERVHAIRTPEKRTPIRPLPSTLKRRIPPPRIKSGGKTRRKRRRKKKKTRRRKKKKTRRRRKMNMRGCSKKRRRR
jgi:hypothetical protein